MTRRTPLPHRFRDAPFGRGEAVAAGVREHRLQASDLVAPHHGVRAHAAPVTVLDHARALMPVLSEDTAFSHTTAALLWGIPLPRRHETTLPLHVTTTRGDRRTRRRAVVGHRTADDAVALEEYRGVRVLDPCSTWISLITVLDLDELVVAGDAIVGELRLETHETFVGRVRPRIVGRGATAARAALAEVRPGSRSAGETRLRLVLTRGGLPLPASNHDVVVDGRWIACVDFAWPDLRLAIEYDSDLHRTHAAAYRNDVTRGERLKDAGWWMARATADDVGPNRDEFLARIRRLRARRAVEIRQ